MTAASPMRIDALALIVEHHEARLIDGFWVDVTTASMLVKVYEALSLANRVRFESIPLPRLVDFGWKHVKVAS